MARFKLTDKPVEKYPRIKQLGLEIVNEPIKHVKREPLRDKLTQLGIYEIFCDKFGQQTCIAEGLYPWDVEDCLELVLSGKKQGGQHPLLWD